MLAEEGITIATDDEATDYLQFVAAGVCSDDGRLLHSAKAFRICDEDQLAPDDLQRALSIIRATSHEKKRRPLDDPCNGSVWTDNMDSRRRVELTGSVKMNDDNNNVSKPQTSRETNLLSDPVGILGGQ